MLCYFNVRILGNVLVAVALVPLYDLMLQYFNILLSDAGLTWCYTI